VLYPTPEALTSPFPLLCGILEPGMEEILTGH
jgi:hypothetical protein